MKLIFRPAEPEDAAQLLELRRASIAVLAPGGMSAARAQVWAANLTLPGMEKKLRGFEVWIAAVEDMPAAWGAIHGNKLEGLYTHPDVAGRGIGTRLLEMLEGLLRERGHVAVRIEASKNAEGFYLKRGYKPAGAPIADESMPLIKRLVSAP
ncbi:MAG: GNAT family N-acetyltransferase [Rhodospirillaceae bacterium]